MTSDTAASMRDRIRRVIAEHGHLPVDVATLDDDADLYQAGMTSHASVNVMLALEDAFDVEFPDRMLKRSVFESIAAIDGRARRAAGARPHERSGRPRPGVPGRRSARSPTRSPRRTPTTSTATRASRSESIDALPRPSARCRRSSPRNSAAAASRFEAIAAACFELGRRCGASAMVFAMHQIQVSTIVRHLDGRRLVRAIPARRRAGAAPDRLGHLRDRHRRRHGPVDRGRHARTSTGRGHVREAGADRLATARYADDLLTTLRRAPDAEPGDQVLVLTRKDQVTLEQTGTWDPLGHARHVLARLRRARRRSRPSRSCPAPFSTVVTESMVPVSHILWSHLWLGIATDAFDRARAFVRASAKSRPEPVAADRSPAVAADERAVAAARRGQHRRSRDFVGRQRRGRPRAALDDGDRSCASTTSRSPPPSRRRGSARAR